MSSERKEGKIKRNANALIFPADKRTLANQQRTMMEHSDLLEIVRRPLSPDVEVEVQASREEYERVEAILENEESKYPRLWYDGTRNVAIVAAPPSRLHSNMVGGLLASIIREVSRNQGISSEVGDGLTLSTESGNTRGRTTRGWDGVIEYQEPNRSSLMIAVEVGVSQSYESLRAAISWSVCALHCRLGIVICIREQGRRQTPHPLQYSSIQVENAAVDEAEQDFRRQLMERPYGPLVRDGVTWFGRIKRVVLETYRIPDEDVLPETLLQPSRSFTIVEEGEFVGGDVPPNLQEVVLGDCIPDHILSGEAIVATPVNFFRRAWFEAQFKEGMVSTAGNRMRPRPE
ncbi:hypothetical protein V1520DRAFT_358640 [Lipomyces starkeyi]|uniref:Restriction endonuclease domain-containing protein n=1 Tax=Lipomyces starkeyi NRRL Y-11557 TaxID=675824 RepID=A0A1E3PVX7_LIPST|nr:hypothetical protein LIPSTDRAFT_6771 [Lipomyces starkeyi NRRL Y-11557]